MWDLIKLLVQNDAMKYLIGFECLKSMKIVPIVTGFVCPVHSFVMFKADKKLISRKFPGAVVRIVSKTEERTQAPVLLEHLPPWCWICDTHHGNHQHFQGSQHFGPGKEVEIGIHNRDRDFGRRSPGFRSDYMDCCVDEEIK